MPEAIGGIVGGLFGGDSGGGSQQTATKEPWSEAAPWLRQIIQDGQDLQGYYQKTPFNQPQQQSYSNLYGDLDIFRNQIAPGLMGFANQLMGTNYQRSQQPSGLLTQTAPTSTNMQPSQMQGVQQGLLSQGANNGVFSMSPRPQSSYGLLDFQALNPFAAILAQREAESAQKPANDLINDQIIEDYLRRRDPQAWQEWDSSRRLGQGGA